MATEKHTGAVKRFGPRYGSIVKQKFSKIESQQRSLYKCPYCARVEVKRIAAGIWQCKKCNAKFASKAYTIPKKKRAQELTEGTSAEDTKEETSTEEQEE